MAQTNGSLPINSSLKPQDPMERLASARKEFGEHGGVNASIENSVTFTVMEVDHLSGVFDGRFGPEKGGLYFYGRDSNPTVRYLGRQLAALEGTEAAYATASGMGAITSALLNVCDSGDHVVASTTLYGGTFAALRDFFPKKFGITTTFVPIDDPATIQAAITPRTKVLYAETCANPTLAIADIPALAELAHAHGLTFMVDNTFTPLVVSPALHGADVVLHSLTKYISGGGDIMAGAVCGTKAFIDGLLNMRDGPLVILGPVLDPRTASDLSLRLPHVGLRVAEHSRRALGYAEQLQEAGLAVAYPGLKSHPHHARLEALRNPGFGYGGMIAVDLGSYAKAVRFMEALQNDQGFGLLAVSLGYFDTLLCASASSTSSMLSEEDLRKAGIQPGLVRMSVGITGSYEQRSAQLLEVVKCIAGEQNGNGGQP